ncbi:MAG: hypothetical protein NT040_03305 [Bacteroidetes bacterium]|nr:hypothetical protein [Bacteroidota bacterium]
MKYFHWFKGFVFIALTCSVTAQGSTTVLYGSGNNPQNNEPSTGYTISVSAGQVQNSHAEANLTICGANSKVSVEKKGTVTLVAGESIVFHPGTRISNGGFLYASIEPRSKNGKRQKKEVTLVTIEENNKIEEQATLATAYDMFKPFPTHTKGLLHAGDAEQGSFNASSNELSGVTPEQQRKVAVDSRLLHEVTRKQVHASYNLIPVAYAYRAETMRVLRL